MLTQAQLSSIENDQSITVTTSSNVDPLDAEAHTHQFTIAKMS
jgi:hypothetical protein